RAGARHRSSQFRRRAAADDGSRRQGKARPSGQTRLVSCGCLHQEAASYQIRGGATPLTDCGTFPSPGVKYETAAMATAEDDEDRELIERMRRGSAEAFAALYRRRQGGLHRFATLMTGCSGMAEEVTQEVFLALVRDPSGYDERRGSVAAYLYGIARYQVMR